MYTIEHFLGKDSKSGKSGKSDKGGKGDKGSKGSKDIFKSFKSKKGKGDKKGGIKSGIQQIISYIPWVIGGTILIIILFFGFPNY